MVEAAFFWLSFAIFVYFVFYSLTTFGLICRSLYETALTGMERGRLFTPPERRYRPGISLIAPAYNMAPMIAASARALLAADYDPLEVVIVDDGSEDGTTAALDAAFDLVELPVGDRMKIPTRTVLRYYISRSDPRLRVLQKENGGRSDAINAGLNVAHKELVAIVDADTLLERDALKRIVEVFAADPDNVVAVGGSVRVANGALIEQERGRRPARRPRRHGGKPDRRVSAQLPRRADRLVGDERAGDHLRRLRRLPARPGPGRRRAVAADARRGHGAGDAPAPSAAPAAAAHSDRPRPGRERLDGDPGRARPAARAADPLACRPLRQPAHPLEDDRPPALRRGRALVAAVRAPLRGRRPAAAAAGMVIVVVLVGLHAIDWPYAVALFVVMLLVGQLQTAGAILIEEVGFRRYTVRDLMLLAGWSLVELLWYRPLNALWRLWATVLVLLGRRPGWGTIPRGAAFSETPETELAPAPLPR